VRTVPQAEGLERVLLDLGRTVDGVLVFDVGEDELVRRLSSRTTCDVCQTPYMGRPVGSACDKNDDGTLVRRPDDEPDAVRNRLAVFQRQTAPVLDWYGDNATRVVHIDATGTPDDVAARAIRALKA
jgi:adenylate kinase